MKKKLAAIATAAVLLLGIDAAEAGQRVARSKSRSRGKTEEQKSPAKSLGKSSRSTDSRRSGKRKRREAPPKLPARLELKAVDLSTHTLEVEAAGLARPPETRLFVLTDERGRRFVPAAASCRPADAATAKAAQATDADEGKEAEAATEAASGRWLCRVEVARLYQRSPLTAIAMEWGDRIVEVPSASIKTRYAQAQASSGTTLPTLEPPSDEPPPLGTTMAQRPKDGPPAAATKPAPSKPEPPPPESAVDDDSSDHESESDP